MIRNLIRYLPKITQNEVNLIYYHLSFNLDFIHLTDEITIHNL